MPVIFGVGTDIVAIARIAQTYQRFGQRFLRRAYHPAEIQRATHLHPAQRDQYLASRCVPARACTVHMIDMHARLQLGAERGGLQGVRSRAAAVSPHRAQP